MAPVRYSSRRSSAPQAVVDVDASGAASVTADLARICQDARDGTVVDLGGAMFRSDQTLLLRGLAGIKLVHGGVYTDDITGGLTKTRDIRARSHVRLEDCVGVECDLTIRGAHPGGGLGDAAYDADLEGQHGYNVAGGSGNVLRGEVSYVWGDIAYFGGRADGCTADRLHGHHNGRQGISVTNATRTSLLSVWLHHIRRTVFDLEPARNDWLVDDVLIDSPLVGPHRLTGLGASSSAGHITNVTLRGLRDGPGDDERTGFNVIAGNGSNPFRQGPFALEDIALHGTTGGPQPVMRFTDCDGVRVAGTDMPMQGGRGQALVGVRRCTGVDVPADTNRVRTTVKGKPGQYAEPGDAELLREF